MSELKTKATNASVKTFLDAIKPDQKRTDARTLDKLMRRITGKKPKMWGASLVGYGTYKYKYESGHQGEWFITGFSPRKQNLVVYIMPGFETFKPQMKKLGKHKTGKSCLYINKLADVDLEILQELIAGSVEVMKDRYGP